MQVRLTEAQIRRLKEVAEREGCSVAAVVRRCLDRELRDRGVARALAMSRSVRSGLGDLAENHDRYLADDLAGRE